MSQQIYKSFFLKKQFVFLFLFLSLLFSVSLKAQYIQFTENKGQWDNRVKFAGEINGGGFFLEQHGYRVLINSGDDWKKIADYYGSHTDSASPQVLKNNGKNWVATGGKNNNYPQNQPQQFLLHSHAYEVTFLGAMASPQIVPDKDLGTYNNYYIGNDKSKWASGCKIYEAVEYKNMYPGIDVRYYTYNNQLKYDIIVHPGGDINKIALQFDGANRISVKKGNLIIGTSLGDITELSPVSYQTSASSKTSVPVSFSVSGNVVKFKAGAYDKSTTLVIDPTLIFCTFSGSPSDNWGYTATYDGQGNLYAGGVVFGTGFPTTLGAASSVFSGGDASEGAGGGTDIGIEKFNKTGTVLLYGTYLGGKNDEQPHSLVVDADGNLILGGRSNSKDYPTTIGKYGPAEAANSNDVDIILTKLDSKGAIMASRRIGGSRDDGVNIRPKYVQPLGTASLRRNYGDDARSEVITDDNRNIYLASATQSPDYPVSASAFQTTFGKGLQDGVLIKASSDLKTIYLSSFLGGSENDAAFVLALNPTDNNIFVAGATESKDMPGIANSYKGGETDGFVSIIANNTYQLVKTAYFGTGGVDMIYGIQFDKFGFPYIMGTTSGTWPVVNAAWSQTNGKQFIAKLKKDLSDYEYSTVFGKGTPIPDISPIAFLVDRCENVYVSGWSGGTGNSPNIPYYPGQSSIGLYIPTTPRPVQSTTDGSDFYFFVLKRDAVAPLYASFFGQKGGYGDHVDGGTSRFDKQGVIYHAVCANCNKGVRFPTTIGVVSPNNNAQTGAKCNLAAFKLAFELAGIGNGVRASINGRAYDTTGCVPLTVQFIDTLNLGKQFVWNFGDGSPEITTLVDSISHTYTQIGDYRVRLISIDSSACNIADTAYTTIRARRDKAQLSFDPIKLPPCTSLAYQFNNTSTAPAGKPFNSRSFVWDFGDGTIDTTVQPPVHTYASEGTYLVKLSLIDTNYCNAPDELIDTLRIAANVKAQFTTPSFGCAPYTAVFNNTSLAGHTFTWNFGDGTTGTDESPTHVYDNPGNYTVTLTAYDSATCNKQSTSAPFTIVVSPNPVAGFNFTPVQAQNNTPTSFFNISTGATSYKWIFGDGDELVTAKLDTTIKHIYDRTDTFRVDLIAYNQYGCADTATNVVSSIITPLVDVPNAISPTGTNRTISVKGYGIDKMDWRIYNRWGVLVFNATSQKTPWDGTYKGVLQPQEVYTYILNVEFSDGTKYKKTGDITLIR